MPFDCEIPLGSENPNPDPTETNGLKIVKGLLQTRMPAGVL